MGVTDLFTTANSLLSRELHYHIDPANADYFRGLCDRAGIRRVTHAIKLTKLQDIESPQERHAVLEAIIWQLVPKRSHTAILRNPHAQSMRREVAAMDARVMELVGDERQ